MKAKKLIANFLPFFSDNFCTNFLLIGILIANTSIFTLFCNFSDHFEKKKTPLIIFFERNQKNKKFFPLKWEIQCFNFIVTGKKVHGTLLTGRSTKGSGSSRPPSFRSKKGQSGKEVIFGKKYVPCPSSGSSTDFTFQVCELFHQ